MTNVSANSILATRLAHGGMIVIIVLVAGKATGCLMCTHPFDSFLIRGEVVDADTLNAISDVAISVETLSAGEPTGSGGTMLTFIDENFVQDNGTFQVFVGSNERGTVCPGFLGRTGQIPELPPPEEQ